MDEEVPTPEYQFDYSEIPLSKGFVDAHQEGNYLIATTENGVRFRHRIPADKMLDKNEKGEFVLVPLRHVEG